MCYFEPPVASPRFQPAIQAAILFFFKAGSFQQPRPPHVANPTGWRGCRFFSQTLCLAAGTLVGVDDGEQTRVGVGTWCLRCVLRYLWCTRTYSGGSGAVGRCSAVALFRFSVHVEHRHLTHKVDCMFISSSVLARLFHVVEERRAGTDLLGTASVSKYAAGTT